MTSMTDLGGSLLLLGMSSLPWTSRGGNSGVDSLVCSGGVGDRVVIRTGSSQCIMEGYSVVPQWYGFSRGGKEGRVG